MEAETIFEVIKKLTGEVEPIADSAVDAQSLINMQTFIEVFNTMHLVIDGIATAYKDSPYHSEKVIGELAAKHIESMGIE